MAFTIPPLPPRDYADLVGSSFPGPEHIDQAAWESAVGTYSHLPEHIDTEGAWDSVQTNFRVLLMQNWREFRDDSSLVEIRAYVVVKAAMIWIANVGRGEIGDTPAPRLAQGGVGMDPKALDRLLEHREAIRRTLAADLSHQAVLDYVLEYTYVGPATVAALLGLSPAQFSRLEGKPPSVLLPGTSTRRYLLGDLIEWIGRLAQ